MTKIDFSLVLACYNEGPTFEANIALILSELKRLKIRWEIIFVEDKSTDGTKKTLEKITGNIKNCSVIYHNKNMGRGRSVSDGIKMSKGSICGYIDVDCEIAPRYIPLFIEEVQNGSDIVIGNRFYEKGLKSLPRVFASRIYAKLIKLTLNLPVGDTESGYKFFNRKTTMSTIFETKNKGWFWDTEVCARAYYKDLSLSEVPVFFVRRTNKKSTVKLFSDSLSYLVELYKFRSKIATKHLNK